MLVDYGPYRTFAIILNAAPQPAKAQPSPPGFSTGAQATKNRSEPLVFQNGINLHPIRGTRSENVARTEYEAAGGRMKGMK